MDWAGRTEGRGNAGKTVGFFFHPSGPPEFGYLIQRKRLILLLEIGVRSWPSAISSGESGLHVA
jgi:hypothetical protein